MHNGLSVSYSSQRGFLFILLFFYSRMIQRRRKELLFYPQTGNEGCSCASSTRLDLSERKAPVK